MWEAANAPSRDEHRDASIGEPVHSNFPTQGPHDPNSIIDVYATNHPVSVRQRQTRHRTVSTETIEAALARLSKAYTSSMECIGAVHKTNQMLMKEKQRKPRPRGNLETESDLSAIESPTAAPRKLIHRVSNVARTTLETAIFLDPLMIPHLPTLHRSMIELSVSIECDQKVVEDDSDLPISISRWQAVKEKRPIPPTITSAAHKSTLLQLAYLSLVNYSDLLQQSGCSPSKTGPKSTILDRGILSRLNCFDDDSVTTSSCWDPEDSVVTQKLVVAALCDASNLDGSDPIMWLKLACASRKLENLLDAGRSKGEGSISPGCTVQRMTTLERLKHRNLQRHALERGSRALPKHMPPNRTILRALDEFFLEPETEEYYSGDLSMNTTASVCQKKIELTRYSWTVLGKMILRACKGEDGIGMIQSSCSPSVWLASGQALLLRNNHSSISMFGSPKVVVNLSPMLVLPSSILGQICQYLENTCIWKFEATCRALSVSIIAGRASMEEFDEDEDDDDAADLLLKQHEQRQRETLEKMNDPEGNKKGDSEMETKTQKIESQPVEPAGNEGSSNDMDTESNNNANTKYASSQRHSYRSSKRLRSQQISTGKKQDREAKRKSFDYCFVAATLSCTKTKHDDMASALRKKEEFLSLFEESYNPISHSTIGKKSRFALRTQTSTKNALRNNLKSTQAKHIEARERIGDASLSVFVQNWSSNNSGPMDLLEGYLAHVALFTEDVFASDSPAIGLHSCILSSFQVLLLRSGSHQSIFPKFYNGITERRTTTEGIKFFAMDLLHAELILRQCDRHAPRVVQFDDDTNMISLMIPSLVRACDELTNEIVAKEKSMDQNVKEKFTILKTRCYWLTASFFLWRSRIAREIHMSREAEDEAIHFLGMAMKCFLSPALKGLNSIKTPHLVSPGRQDSYWREISPTLLSKFRDEIQASSVVSHARQQFQEVTSSLEQVDLRDGELSTSDAGILANIGQRLFERYDSEYCSSESKLVELVDNFLTTHGDELLMYGNASKEGGNEGHGHVHNLLLLEPYKVQDLQRVSNPTILSMLVICLNMDQGNRLSIAQLLVRLILTSKDVHSSFVKEIASFRSSRKQTDTYHSDDAISDSDDDSFDGNEKSFQRGDIEKKARQCGYFMKLLLNSLQIFQSYLSATERRTLVASTEFDLMIESVLDFSNRWFRSAASFLRSASDTLDQDIIYIVRKITKKTDSMEESGDSETVIFRGLIQIIISQTMILKKLTTSQVDRSHRTARQRTCIQRGRYIGIVASELACILSTHLSTVEAFAMKKGSLFKGSSLEDLNRVQTQTTLKVDEEILFLHAVRWLKDFALQNTGDNSGITTHVHTSSSFDRPVKRELKIPVSTLVIALCGSSSCTRSSSYLTRSKDSDQDQDTDVLSLQEFFDTDTSANDWESEGEDESKSARSKKELLRVICHATQCIVLVLDTIDEKDAVTKFLENYCNPEFGALLPLIAVRVLNFFADTLLLYFGDESADGKNRTLLWLESYSYHTKHVGDLLDTCLHKAYRWLYGFALVGEAAHHLSAGNDSTHSVNPITEIVTRAFKLESTTAAGQLYRCITRAYAGGRRTPPKQALEAVSAALPPHRESDQSKALRRFVFSPGKEDFLDVNSILRMEDGWDSAFAAVQDSIKESEDSLDDGINNSLDEVDATRVRRGLSKQLALGPLPIVTSDPKTKTDVAVDDDRSQTHFNEIAISKKFNAIFDDLCLSDAGNWEGWYRAAQCCVMKADAIADRLGFTLGFSRIENFLIPKHRGLKYRSIDIDRLKEDQEFEEESTQINILGHDYSVYVDHAWSSFPSLRDCISKLKENCVRGTNNHHEKRVCLTVWEDIDSYYLDGNYLRWQEACGGIFVSALRDLASRLMCVALYILQSNRGKSSDLKVLLSDVCETLGNIYYSQLMASQRYGWPMRVLTYKRKREFAVLAKACYLASIKHADDSVDEGDNNEDHSTWDLQFMVGKCEEKIACTYEKEAFSEYIRGLPGKIRQYEYHMSRAISVYSEALTEANKLEEAGTQLLDSGGSGHGATEILYRFHACRLKCLIRAVSRSEKDRDQAQREALRLTEEPGTEKSSSAIRERIWAVYADVVNSLAECRKIKPFFHRSVYRHAQALLWSPVFFDPMSNNGSMDIVPISHSSQIQGLDGSKPAAFSAENVLSVLFDKKRTQLCAVWVTNSGAASPFQAMNSTVRKYDSLRGKYIGAYLEVLRLCGRRSETETFMKWLFASKRDLASYFQAGAINGGDRPTLHQTKDPMLLVANRSDLMSHGFLLSIKRKANSVFASILMSEISRKLNATQSSKATVAPERTKISEFYLRQAYASYLRLNCSIEDLNRARAWQYGSDSVVEVDALCQAFLATGETVEEIRSNDFGDWSGGARKSMIFNKALSKCEELFPSLSAYAVFAKSKAKKAKTSSLSSNNNEGDGKRKSPAENDEIENVSFEVAVPSGLTSGDTFLTTVKVGNSDPMKVKLTVPEGEHSTLRFNLKVPKSKESNKKAKLI